MKLSLKIRDEHQHHKNPLFKAKVPISISGLPFLSALTAGDPSDLSFNLSTHFPTGPSLKLSYTPTASAAATPFALSLKSGIGLFGSSRDSPLVVSAHFNLSSSYNPNPTFSLQFKPQFGQFSLHKTTFSNPNPSCSKQALLESESDAKVNAFTPEGSMAWTNITLESSTEKIGIPNFNQDGIGLRRPLVWRDLTMESCNVRDGILSGVKVRANTALPVTSRFVANFRWGLNFPAESGGRKLPFLTVDKIGIERVERVNADDKPKGNEDKSNAGDVELLKGMCNWMRSDLEVLHKENLELRQSFEKMKLGISARNSGLATNTKLEKQKLSPAVDNTGDSKWWNSKRSGGDYNGGFRKSVDCVSDIESELQKAIKAASS